MLKVFTIASIILGNTHFFFINGPLRNLQISQQITNHFFFSFVLSADLFSDLFFWITGFSWAYILLKKMHQNGGIHEEPVWKIIFARYLRLAPLYYFMIVVLWKYVPTMGGRGPRFFLYEEQHGCKDTWFWHITFLNNLFPWSTSSNCLRDSWYLANDLQFFCLLCCLTFLYYNKRKWYNVALISIIAVCVTI